jgi:hypothetical protein
MPERSRGLCYAPWAFVLVHRGSTVEMFLLTHNSKFSVGIATVSLIILSGVRRLSGYNSESRSL